MAIIKYNVHTERDRHKTQNSTLIIIIARGASLSNIIDVTRYPRMISVSFLAAIEMAPTLVLSGAQSSL